MVTWNRLTALASARRVAALEPTRLAVGHGPVIDDPQAPIADAIAEAERAFKEQ